MKYRLVHTNFYKEVNNNYQCVCPFCGKELHFYMNVITGLFDCKKCGRSGNYYQYLQALKKDIDNRDLIGDKINFYKVELLETVVALPNSFAYPNKILAIEKFDIYYNYFVKKRKFRSSLLSKYYCFHSDEDDYAFKERLIVPLFGVDGIISGFCGRAIKDCGKRYYNSRGTKFSQLLFNYENILGNDYNFVVVVEGLFDSLRLDTISVATFGKKISKEQISYLLELKKDVIVMFDNDANKENYKYAKELSEAVENVYIFDLPYSDPDEYFKNMSDILKIGNILKGMKKIKQKFYLYQL